MLIIKYSDYNKKVFLEYKPIKKYSAGFILYNVYKITDDNKQKFLYKETLNELDRDKLFNKSLLNKE